MWLFRSHLIFWSLQPRRIKWFWRHRPFLLVCFSPTSIPCCDLSLPWLDKHRYIYNSWGLCSLLHTPCREPQGNHIEEEEELRVLGSELEQGFSAGLARLNFAASAVRAQDQARWPWNCQRLEGGERLQLPEGSCFSNPGCSSNPGFGGLDRPCLVVVVVVSCYSCPLKYRNLYLSGRPLKYQEKSAAVRLSLLLVLCLCAFGNVKLPFSGISSMFVGRKCQQPSSVGCTDLCFSSRLSLRGSQ